MLLVEREMRTSRCTPRSLSSMPYAFLRARKRNRAQAGLIAGASSTTARRSRGLGPLQIHAAEHLRPVGGVGAPAPARIVTIAPCESYGGRSSPHLERVEVGLRAGDRSVDLRLGSRSSPSTSSVSARRRAASRGSRSRRRRCGRRRCASSWLRGLRVVPETSLRERSSSSLASGVWRRRQRRTLSRSGARGIFDRGSLASDIGSALRPGAGRAFPHSPSRGSCRCRARGVEDLAHSLLRGGVARACRLHHRRPSFNAEPRRSTLLLVAGARVAAFSPAVRGPRP